MRYDARFILLSLLLTISVGYGAERDAHTHAAPESVGMSSSGLAKIDDVMNRRVAEGKLAGGVVVVARRGKVIYHKSFGQRDMDTGLRRSQLPQHTIVNFAVSFSEPALPARYRMTPRRHPYSM